MKMLHFRRSVNEPLGLVTSCYGCKTSILLFEVKVHEL